MRELNPNFVVLALVAILAFGGFLILRLGADVEDPQIVIATAIAFLSPVIIGFANLLGTNRVRDDIRKVPVEVQGVVNGKIRAAVRAVLEEVNEHGVPTEGGSHSLDAENALRKIAEAPTGNVAAVPGDNVQAVVVKGDV